MESISENKSSNIREKTPEIIAEEEKDFAEHEKEINEAIEVFLGKESGKEEN